MERKPIKVIRTPIKLPQNVKALIDLERAQELTRDDDIMAIAEHYDMLAREVLGKGGYNSLSLYNPKKHRNWRHFEMVYELCRMQKWDAKLYLESQFSRGKDWVAQYPFPNNLYSLNAMRYFTNYLADIKQKHKKDTNKKKKEKGRETTNVRQDIVQGVMSTVSILDRYIQRSNADNLSEYKVLKIFQSWAELSPYYLWSIPWFHDFIRDMPEDKHVNIVRKEFDMIRSSKSIQKTIEQTVQEVEKHFNIPPNLEIQ